MEFASRTHVVNDVTSAFEVVGVNYFIVTVRLVAV